MEDVSLFPEDLLINILLRLPIKYVLRLRSVCKNWNFMLRSPNFISLYYNHQSRGQERLEKDGVSSFIVLEYVENACYELMYPNPPPPSEYDSYDPAHLLLSFLTIKKMGNELITTVDKVEKFDILLTSPSLNSLSTQDRHDVDLIMFTYVYDGIICLGNDIGIVLYNPYTRESQRLPFLPSTTNPDCDYNYVILGMWFDSNQQPETIKHYKIFRVVNLFHSYDDPKVGNTYVIEKYDSAEGSWREIKKIHKRQYQYRCDKCLLFNEMFYLYVDGDSVVTLDARLEKFGLLPLPSEFLDRDFEYFCVNDLFVLGRSLALFAQNRDRNFCKDIWMMTEYGVKESWTKQYTFLEGDFKLPSGMYEFGFGGMPFDFSWRLLAPWKCIGEDELFVETWDPNRFSMWEKGNSKLISFNLLLGKGTEINFRRTRNLLAIVPYMESFFSFK
ncbi:F-box/kelch-repeat protein At3g06240-like [Impatiens glandulifera]|uniref:F-box/kelch-repeat protein At3g06240-like n=1 Tax=Impatiens glandulifera TaxID=253017 RepID=UPI001FB0E238|nr:F-box/kelch-repeat protein At3g06240-like [Impatiens glandulifera]